MKRILFAGAMALAAASPALAADLPQPYTPPPPRAPATYVPTTAPEYDWGGIYFGLNGGYGFGSSEWSDSAGSTGTFNLNGGLVGPTVGANFQMGQFVFGVEGDIDWADISGTASNSNAFCPSCETKNDWLGTVRLRAGYAFDRVLVFATGGGAFGDEKAIIPAALGGGSSDSTEFGWTAGAGIEGAFAQNWTVKLEYLFVDLGNSSCTTVCGSTTLPTTVKFDTSLIRAGLNYKFNGF